MSKSPTFSDPLLRADPARTARPPRSRSVIRAVREEARPDARRPRDALAEVDAELEGSGTAAPTNIFARGMAWLGWRRPKTLRLLELRRAHRRQVQTAESRRELATLVRRLEGRPLKTLIYDLSDLSEARVRHGVSPKVTDEELAQALEREIRFIESQMAYLNRFAIRRRVLAAVLVLSGGGAWWLFG